MQEIPAPIVQYATLSETIRFETGEIEFLYGLPEGLFYLDEAIHGIKWDAKYATTDNFTGDVVDGYESNRIVVSKGMVDRLIKAQKIAKDKGYQLLIWDAVRPQRAVDCFVEWSNMPEDGRTKAAHYPHLKKSQLFGEYIAHRSGHSRGNAVDLTLLTSEGEEVDMGGGFDLMDPISHHGASGLTNAQTQNRNTLKRIMEKAGFSAYESEWWHYSFKSSSLDTYYDFAIGGKPRKNRYIK